MPLIASQLPSIMQPLLGETAAEATGSMAPQADSEPLETLSSDPVLARKAVRSPFKPRRTHAACDRQDRRGHAARCTGNGREQAEKKVTHGLEGAEGDHGGGACAGDALVLCGGVPRRGAGAAGGGRWPRRGEPLAAQRDPRTAANGGRARTQCAAQPTARPSPTGSVGKQRHQRLLPCSFAFLRTQGVAADALRASALVFFTA